MRPYMKLDVWADEPCASVDGQATALVEVALFGVVAPSEIIPDQVEPQVGVVGAVQLLKYIPLSVVAGFALAADILLRPTNERWLVAVALGRHLNCACGRLAVLNMRFGVVSALVPTYSKHSMVVVPLRPTFGVTRSNPFVLEAAAPEA